MKIRDFLKKNVWITFFGAAVCIGFLCGWGVVTIFSMQSVQKTEEMDLSASDSKSVTEIKGHSKLDNANVVDTEKGYKIINESGEELAGPYDFIYAEDIHYAWDSVARVIDDGLIGYITRDGDVLCEPIYTEATPMESGTALVKEINSGFYFINDDGQRIIDQEYYAAYPFEESQGSYARVQKEQDGEWSVIYRNGELVLEDMQKINELPYITTLGTGIRSDGTPILFELSNGEENKCSVIAEFGGYTDISECYFGEFCLLQTSEGLYTVADCWGNILAEAKYVRVDYEEMDDGSYIFLGRKADGTYDILNMK